MHKDIRNNISKFRECQEFRKFRGQTQEPTKPTPPSRQRRNPSSPYEVLLRKYSDLENTIDELGTRDLVYYFRQVAEENGYKYVISNIKKDMAIMKRLRGDFDNRDICAMIEFLYVSDQDYLDKPHLSINLLASQWINTIYPDTMLWVDDKYTPKSKTTKKQKLVSKKEWDKKSDDNASIGVKL